MGHKVSRSLQTQFSLANFVIIPKFQHPMESQGQEEFGTSLTLSLAQNLGCYSPPNKNQFWCRWSMVQMCTCLMGHSEPSHMCTFAHFPYLIGLITNLSYHRLWLSYLSCVCLCLFFIIKIL